MEVFSKQIKKTLSPSSLQEITIQNPDLAASLRYYACYTLNDLIVMCEYFIRNSQDYIQNLSVFIIYALLKLPPDINNSTRITGYHVWLDADIKNSKSLENAYISYGIKGITSEKTLLGIVQWEEYCHFQSSKILINYYTSKLEAQAFIEIPRLDSLNSAKELGTLINEKALIRKSLRKNYMKKVLELITKAENSSQNDEDSQVFIDTVNAFKDLIKDYDPDPEKTKILEIDVETKYEFVSNNPEIPDKNHIVYSRLSKNEAKSIIAEVNYMKQAEKGIFVDFIKKDIENIEDGQRIIFTTEDIGATLTEEISRRKMYEMFFTLEEIYFLDSIIKRCYKFFEDNGLSRALRIEDFVVLPNGELRLIRANIFGTEILESTENEVINKVLYLKKS